MKILIIYNLEDEYIERIKKAFTTAEIVKAIEFDDIKKEIIDADVILALGFNAELLSQAKKLRWIQSIGAGVENFLFPEFVDSRVILTDASGIHPKQISEHILGLILAFTRKLNVSMRSQLQKKWEMLTGDELTGKVLGIVGLGNIGNEIARKAKCFDMTVIATKRSPAAKPAYVDELLPYTR